MKLTEQQMAVLILLAAAAGQDVQARATRFLRALPACKTEGCGGRVLGLGAYCSAYCRTYSQEVSRQIAIDRQLSAHREYRLGDDSDE